MKVWRPFLIAPMSSHFPASESDQNSREPIRRMNRLTGLVSGAGSLAAISWRILGRKPNVRSSDPDRVSSGPSAILNSLVETSLPEDLGTGDKGRACTNFLRLCRASAKYFRSPNRVSAHASCAFSGFMRCLCHGSRILLFSFRPYCRTPLGRVSPHRLV